MAQQKIIYRYIDRLVVYKADDLNANFNDNEIGNLHRVATLDLTQEQLDDISLNGLPISDIVEIGCLLVDDADNPTTIERVT